MRYFIPLALIFFVGCGYEKQTEITSRNETIREGEYIKNKLLISTPAEDKAFILSIYDGVDSIDRAIRGTDANTQTHSLIGDKPTAVSTPAATATQPATSTPATPAASTGGKTK